MKCLSTDRRYPPVTSLEQGQNNHLEVVGTLLNAFGFVTLRYALQIFIQLNTGILTVLVFYP